MSNNQIPILPVARNRFQLSKRYVRIKEKHSTCWYDYIRYSHSRNEQIM